MQLFNLKSIDHVKFILNLCTWYEKKRRQKRDWLSNVGTVTQDNGINIIQLIDTNLRCKIVAQDISNSVDTTVKTDSKYLYRLKRIEQSVFR